MKTRIYYASAACVVVLFVLPFVPCVIMPIINQQTAKAIARESHARTMPEMLEYLRSRDIEYYIDKDNPLILAAWVRRTQLWILVQEDTVITIDYSGGTVKTSVDLFLTGP